MVLVMELACHMMKLKPTRKNQKGIPNDTQGYFDLSKMLLLSNPNKFLQDMINYDKEHIPESTVKKVNTILNMPTFSLESVAATSQALVGIVKWSMAMMKFHELLKIVNPKKAKVAEMNERLAVTRAGLADKRRKLKEVEEKMAKLNASYQENVDKERSLVSQIESCEKKLERASKIISGLAGEDIRWTETVKTLGSKFEYLIGNCLVAAGMVAYSGPFTAQFRADLESLWVKKISELGVKVEEGVSMKDILEDPVQTKTWTAASLPNDNLSIENAIIMFKSRRWPLMIDP